MIKDKFFSMRLPSEVLEALRVIAAKENRTVASQILHYLQKELDAQK
jgi:hypothetical protein